MKKIFAVFLILSMFMGACAQARTVPSLTPTPSFLVSPSPTATLRPTASATTAVTPTPAPIGISQIGKLGSDEIVSAVVWSPDEKTYAMEGSFGVRLFDAQTKKEIWSYPDLAGRLQFSPNSQFIAIEGIGDGRIFRVSDGFLLGSFEGYEYVPTTFSPNSNLFAYIVKCSWKFEPDCKESIHIWDITLQKEIFKYQAEKVNGDFNFSELKFDPTGTIILASASDQLIYAWDIATGKLSFKLSGHIKYIGGFVFSHNGKTLLSYEENEKSYKIFLWSWETKKHYRTITNNWPNATTDAIDEINFSADDSQLNIIFSHDIYDQYIAFYNLATGQLLPGEAYASREDLFLKAMRTRGDYIRSVDSLAYSPDGQTLAVGSRNFSPIVLWDLRTQKVRAVLEDRCTFLKYNHHGDRLVVLRDSRENWDIASEVSIWDTKTNTKLHSFKVPGAATFDISLDDSTLAVNSFHEIQLWDIQNGVLVRSLETTGWTSGLSYSEDGRSLFATMTKRSENLEGELSIQSWDTSTGALLPETLPSIKLGNSDTALNFYHNILAINHWEPNEIAIWDVKNGQKIQAIPSHFGVGIGLFFTPDNQMAVIARGDGIGFYSVRTGDLIYDFDDSNEHRSAPMAFSADGKMLATWVHDGYIYLWDISCITKRAD